MGELTAASEEIRVKVAKPLAGPSASAYRGDGAGLPLASLREIPGVKQVAFDDERREIIVIFERGQADAESIIGQVLWILLNEKVRISGVTKGRGLEQRVMELTDTPT
jgi:hypothetical protein